MLLRAIPTVNPVVSHDSEALALALRSEKATWQSAKAGLSAIAHSLRTKDVQAEVLLEAGDPEAVIVRTAQTRHAGLIGMVTHRRRGLERVLLGSVAEAVIQQANVPILVVPHDVAVQWADGRPVDVLVALDGSPFAEAAVSAGQDLAHALGGSLRLLRVSDHAGLAAADDYLAQLAGRLEIAGPPVHRQVVVGPSVSAVLLLASIGFIVGIELYQERRTERTLEEEPLFGRWLVQSSLLRGAVVLGATMGELGLALATGQTESEARALAFVTLVLADLGLILSGRSGSRSALRALRSRNLALSAVVGGAVALRKTLSAGIIGGNDPATV